MDSLWILAAFLWLALATGVQVSMLGREGLVLAFVVVVALALYIETRPGG